MKRKAGTSSSKSRDNNSVDSHHHGQVSSRSSISDGPPKSMTHIFQATPSKGSSSTSSGTFPPPDSSSSTSSFRVSDGRTSSSGPLTAAKHVDLPSGTDDRPPDRSSGKHRLSATYIPRPPNAFILFRSSFIRDHSVPDSVEANHSNLSRIAGKLWKSLDPAERKKWEDKAREAQEIHRRQYPDWRFKPGLEQKSKVAARTKDGEDDELPAQDNEAASDSFFTAQQATGSSISEPTQSPTSKKGQSRSRRATICSTSSSVSVSGSVSITSAAKRPSITKAKPRSSSLEKEFETARIQKIAELLSQGFRETELEKRLDEWNQSQSTRFHISSQGTGSRGRAPRRFGPVHVAESATRFSSSSKQVTSSPEYSVTVKHNESSSTPPVSLTSMYKRSLSVPTSDHRPTTRSVDEMPQNEHPPIAVIRETEDIRTATPEEDMRGADGTSDKMDRVSMSRTPTPRPSSIQYWTSPSSIPSMPQHEVSESSGSLICGSVRPTYSVSSFPNSPISPRLSPALSLSPSIFPSSPSSEHIQVVPKYDDLSRLDGANPSHPRTKSMTWLDSTQDGWQQERYDDKGSEWWKSSSEELRESPSWEHTSKNEERDVSFSHGWTRDDPVYPSDNYPQESDHGAWHSPVASDQAAQWDTGGFVGNAFIPDDGPVHAPKDPRRYSVSFPLATSDYALQSYTSSPSYLQHDALPSSSPSTYFPIRSLPPSSYSSLSGWAGETSSTSSHSVSSASDQLDDAIGKDGWLSNGDWQNSIQSPTGLRGGVSDSMIIDS